MYKGNFLRGRLGKALLELACPYLKDGKKPPCKGCRLRAECPYGTGFETEMPNHLQHLGQHSPRPLVVQAPIDSKRLAVRHESLTSGLVAMGRFRWHLPVVLRALGESFYPTPGQSGSALESIRDTVTGREIYLKDLDRLLNYPREIFFPPPQKPLSRVSLLLATPVAIIREGRVQKKFSFSDLYIAFARRLAFLEHIYNEAEEEFTPIPPIEELPFESREYLEWVQVPRASFHTGDEYLHEGVIGIIELEGFLAPILPILQRMELLHVGKNTFYGTGRVIILGWSG
jgi:hypothetical protein